MKLFLLIFILLLGCGTEVGNPLTEYTSGTDNGEDDANSVPSDDEDHPLVARVCGTLTRCYPSLKDQECREHILDVDKFDTRLGLDKDNYQNLKEITLDTNLVVNTVNAEACLVSIEQLSCSDSEIISAYNENNPDRFDNTYKVIPKSEDCENYFD